jgi:hypothetical protein
LSIDWFRSEIFIHEFVCDLPPDIEECIEEVIVQPALALLAMGDPSGL